MLTTWVTHSACVSSRSRMFFLVICIVCEIPCVAFDLCSGFPVVTSGFCVNVRCRREVNGQRREMCGRDVGIGRSERYTQIVLRGAGSSSMIDNQGLFREEPFAFGTWVSLNSSSKEQQDASPLQRDVSDGQITECHRYRN